MFLALEVCWRWLDWGIDPADLSQPVFQAVGADYITNPFYTDHPLLVRTDGAPHSFAVAQRFSRKKGDGRRVALLGGSTVHEWHLARPLVRRLQERTGERVRVINFGMIGCGSERERWSLEEALALSVDVVVLQTGHNEFCSFSNPTLRAHSPPTWRSWSRVIQSGSLLLERQRATTHHPYGPERIPGMPPELKERLYRDFKENLRAIARRCRQANVLLVLGTVPHNLCWAPTGHGRGDDSYVSKTPDELLRLAQADPPDPLASFEWGMRLKREGRTKEAKRWLERVMLDAPSPVCANRRINDIVIEVAGEYCIPLAPALETIERSAADGIPDFQLFRDDCHLTPKGYSLVMNAYAETIADHWFNTSRFK